MTGPRTWISLPSCGKMKRVPDPSLMLTEEYIPMVVRELKGQKALADRAIAQLPPDGLFAVPGEEDNSIAVILKHVSGNMRSRWKDFLATDGEKPNRNRDGEFTLL